MSTTKSIGTATATITAGTISGTTLSVTVLSGTIKIPMLLTGGGVTAGTHIIADAGGGGGTGNYTVDTSQTSTLVSTACGRDFSTIGSWHGSFTTGGWIGETHNDTEFNEQVSLGGSSPTNYERLTVAAGKSIFDSISNPLVYDATKGVGLVNNPAFDVVINVGDNFYMDRMQVRNSRATNSHGCLMVGAFPGLVELNGNLFQDETAVDGDQACLGFNGGGKATNNVIIAWFQHAMDVRNGGQVIANNTIVAPSDKSNTLPAFFTNGSGTVRVINNAVFGFASWGLTSGTTTAASTKNASDLASITGTSAITSLTFANQFNAVATTGPADFRPKSGNGLVAGNTDTTDIPGGLDCFGVTRAATWTIGAMEYVTAAAGNPFLNLFANPVARAAAALAFVAVTTQPLGTPVGYPSGKPLAQNDWPNPGLRISPWSAVTSQAQGRSAAYYPSFIQPPLNQLDWPNPVRAALNITPLTSQKAGMPFGYLSSDAPFAQRNWPNPGLSLYGFQRATSQPLGRLTALLPVFVQAPFNQYNWPNPVLRVRAADTQPLGTPLVDCTLNGKGTKPFAQTQWPNPRGPYFFAVPQIVNYPSIFRSDGQPGNPWTPVPPVSEIWTPATPASDIWTPQGPASKTWTPQ